MITGEEENNGCEKWNLIIKVLLRYHKSCLEPLLHIFYPLHMPFPFFMQYTESVLLMTF